MTDCIFCKIIRGELPATKVYEDEDILIMKDIHPKATLHYLLIPKEHFLNITELDERRAEVLARGLLKLKELAPSLGLSDGFRIVSNAGRDAFQTVMHLHIHVLGGEMLTEYFGADRESFDR